MNELTELVATGAGLGALGGLIRSMLGVYKQYLKSDVLKIDYVKGGFNLVIGGASGGIAYGVGLLTDPVGVIAAGYAGMDFLEGLLKKQE